LEQLDIKWYQKKVDYITAVRCNLTVQGKNISTIVDSRAAISAISNNLRKELGLKIRAPSNIRL
jgi:hypothetical protein